MTTRSIDLGDGGDAVLIDDGRWAALETLVPDPRPEPVRLAYAAAHLILDDEDAIDWDATMAFRSHLGEHGFGIAEAMDTAQRFDIGWPIARELIERCGTLAPTHGFIAGAGTDHLESVRGADDLATGVLHQIDVIRSAGGLPIVLPMPWLSQCDCEPETYVEVYGEIIRRTNGPILIHWLGPMFLPALDGYFPGDSFDRIMALDPQIVRGVKLSLLDAEHERTVRLALSERDQIVLTGDDHNFATLIAGAPGDETPTRWGKLDGLRVPHGRFSHALLGIFDAIARPAGLALRLLAAGEREAYDTIMKPCETLGRIVFEDPTPDYKAGLAFIAWLNGHQASPRLLTGLHDRRSDDHTRRVIRAAAVAGALTDADTAARRLAAWPGP